MNLKIENGTLDIPEWGCAIPFERTTVTNAEKPEWIKGHYHCRKCNALMECWRELRWKVGQGVSRIGGCDPCGEIMIEYENVLPRWFSLNGLNERR